MFTATVPQQYNGNPQLDWVDSALAIESWLTEHVGRKGTQWDYYTGSQLQEIVFQRERDCTWFILCWSAQ
jgi:hypothetical protein